jgi:hypothetical protein
MKSLSIDLTSCETEEEGIEVARKFLLRNGFAIIQYSPRYFDFMKDNKFGHFTVDHYHAYSLSSSYKPCSHAGTGCQSVDHAWKFSLAQFEQTLNFVLANVQGDVGFYKDMDERVKMHWAKDMATFTVTYPSTPESNSERMGFDNGSQ